MYRVDVSPISAPRPTAPRAAARKMSFKDKHALETLPARLAALQVDVARHQSALSDPNLYARDPARFRVATAALSAAEAALAEAEEQWLTLELLREELEA